MNLEEIIDRVTRLVGPTLASHQIRFELRDSGGPYLTLGDPDQLQQLFLNLFNNSLEAIENSGILSVQLSRSTGPDLTEGDFLTIEVSDTGCGIPPEKLSRIFQPFFTSRSSGGGSGLGLSVSKEIVEQHRGTISVTSRVGEGTRFVILLPELRKTTEIDRIRAKRVAV